MRRWWRSLSRLARILLAVSATGAVVLLLGMAAFLFLPAVGTPSAQALHYSVAAEVGGSDLLDLETCRRRDGDVWACQVLDSQSSGTARYRVVVDGRCWRARKLTPDSYEEGPYLKRRASACVMWRDQLRFWDRVL